MMSLGKVEEYIISKTVWIEYKERLPFYFTADGVTDDTKKRAIFLSVAGPMLYSLIRSLCSLSAPSDVEFSVLLKILDDHFSPKPSKILSRFKFTKRDQRSNETISEFVTDFTKLSENSNFCAQLDYMLRDRLVGGIQDKDLQRKLLVDTKLTLSSALDLTLDLEAAAKQAIEIRGSTNSVNHLKSKVHFNKKMDNSVKSKGKHHGDEYVVHPHDSPTGRRSPDQWTKKTAWHSGTPPGWSRNNSPDNYHSSCLDRRSRSPSPKTSHRHHRSDTIQHCSRSPSPSSAHSLPPQRRPGGRRLPPTPNQPSRLKFDVHSMERINFPSQLHSPLPQHRGVVSVMNFPRLNPSPSHLPKLQMPPLWRDRTSTFLETQCPPLIRTDWQSESLNRGGLREQDLHLYPALSYYEEPLSFEVAASIGRGLRHLPSPLPNGYKPGQRDRVMSQRDVPPIGLRTAHVGLRRSDSDEDDWC